ncbi:M56 family metallopeptidase [Flavihumibacter fluvii]|uniref:M56 family metallopeptidase n=1 Tax=Flavihumibacter fluvii TaxID=2838157 RepID=UPI001BDF6A45|nr:M56 family metallopeptidase [Flavihumibacter fluvii]ULQ54398.1 M48 family metalloprotease [Flavihumibacter fluvii]
MPNPPQAAFLEALGWTILNSWWQFGLLWVLLLFLKKVLPKGSAAFRYNLSLTFLVMGLCWITISFLLRWNSFLNSGYHIATITDNNLHDWYMQATGYLRLALPYISVIYLFWLGINLLKFSKLLWFSQHLKTGGLQKAPVDWRLFLGKMSGHMNIKNSVQLWISDRIDTPMILGWLKPVILLPVTVINQLSPDQLEAILIHELAHIKRNDYFWNMLVALAEVVLYFNPFARWIINEIRVERENSCDDWVLQFPYQPEQYAHALLKLEHQRIGHQSRLVLAARGSSRNLLLFRVQRMLQVPLSNQDHHGRLTVMTIVVIILCMVGLFEPRQEIRQFFEDAIRFPAVSQETQFPQVIHSGNGETQHATKTANKKNARNTPARLQNSPGEVIPMESNDEEAFSLLTTGQDLPKAIEESALPALLTEERTFSLLQGKSLPLTTEPANLNDLPYVPKSSFDALIQRDSIIPNAILAEKLAILQEKEAALQAKLYQVQENWEKIQQEKVSRIELNDQYTLKKEQLEKMQTQVEKQAKAFEQLIEKQTKMLRNQQEKTPRKRKIVHI